MLISTALLLDSNIRNSVCTPAKLPCRRVVEGDNIKVINSLSSFYYKFFEKITMQLHNKSK
jgi:hypothetical protein